MTQTIAEILRLPYSRLVVPEPDGSYRAEIFEFPGCIAVGETAAQALENLEEVAHDWLDVTLASGQKVPEPIEVEDFSGKLVLRLSRSLHRRAAFAAEREGISLNQFISTSLAICVGASEAARTPSTPLQTYHHVTNFNINANQVLTFLSGDSLTPWAGFNQPVPQGSFLTTAGNVDFMGITPPTRRLTHGR